MISYFEITRYFCASKENFCQTVFQGQACSTYWSSFKVSQGSQDLSIDFQSLHFSNCIPCDMISSVQSWHVLISPVSHLCLFASHALAQKMLEHTAVPTPCTQIKESLMSWFQSGSVPAGLTWTLPTQDWGSSTHTMGKGMERWPLIPMRVQEVHEWAQLWQGTFAEQTQAWFRKKITDSGGQTLVKDSHSWFSSLPSKTGHETKWSYTTSEENSKFSSEWARRRQVGHLGKLATLLHYHTV